MVNIVLDAMGSDARPKPEIEAAILATQKLNVNILLVGNQEQIINYSQISNCDISKIKIIHTPEALDMSDHIQEARSKKNNSMKLGMDLVKAGEGDAFVTAGNTGMAMYFARKTLGDIPGVIRPCLCGVFPVKNGKCVVLDIGANAECRPEFLLQFASMGSTYASTILGKTNPSIGLISNGEEEGKGNDLVRETYPLMKEKFTNFYGNIEGKELFNGVVDVAVTDGFTGNVLLKSTEAVAKLILETIRDNIMSSIRTKIGGLIVKPAFDKVKKILDPSEIGAAPLLGIDGLVLVGHGRSGTKAMISAIASAKQAVESGLLQSLKESIN